MLLYYKYIVTNISRDFFFISSLSNNCLFSLCICACTHEHNIHKCLLFNNLYLLFPIMTHNFFIHFLKNHRLLFLETEQNCHLEAKQTSQRAKSQRKLFQKTLNRLFNRSYECKIHSLQPNSVCFSDNAFTVKNSTDFS